MLEQPDAVPLCPGAETGGGFAMSPRVTPGTLSMIISWEQQSTEIARMTLRPGPSPGHWGSMMSSSLLVEIRNTGSWSARKNSLELMVESFTPINQSMLLQARIVVNLTKLKCIEGRRVLVETHKTPSSVSRTTMVVNKWFMLSILISSGKACLHMEGWMSSLELHTKPSQHDLAED